MEQLVFDYDFSIFLLGIKVLILLLFFVMFLWTVFVCSVSRVAQLLL